MEDTGEDKIEHRVGENDVMNIPRNSPITERCPRVLVLNWPQERNSEIEAEQVDVSRGDG